MRTLANELISIWCGETGRHAARHQTWLPRLLRQLSPQSPTTITSQISRDRRLWHAFFICFSIANHIVNISRDVLDGMGLEPMWGSVVRQCGRDFSGANISLYILINWMNRVRWREMRQWLKNRVNLVLKFFSPSAKFPGFFVRTSCFTLVFGGKGAMSTLLLAFMRLENRIM